MKVLLVDDHVLIRSSVSSIIEKILFQPQVFEAPSSSEALMIASAQDLDFIILDLMLPGLSGIQLLPKIAELSPNSKFIIMTAQNIDEDVNVFSHEKVAGVISKSCDLEAIQSSLAFFLMREKPLPLHHFSSHDSTQAFDVGGSIMGLLSRRQKEILALIALGKSNKQISNELFIAEGTVKNHVSQILTILGASNRTEAVLLFKKLY